jgi:hypothetical protein
VVVDVALLLWPLRCFRGGASDNEDKRLGERFRPSELLVGDGKENGGNGS